MKPIVLFFKVYRTYYATYHSWWIKMYNILQRTERSIYILKKLQHCIEKLKTDVFQLEHSYSGTPSEHRRADSVQPAECRKINFVYRSLTQAGRQASPARSVGHVTPTWRRNIRRQWRHHGRICFAAAAAATLRVSRQRCCMRVAIYRSTVSVKWSENISPNDWPSTEFSTLCITIEIRVFPPKLYSNSQYLHSTKKTDCLFADIYMLLRPIPMGTRIYVKRYKTKVLHQWQSFLVVAYIIHIDDIVYTYTDSF